MLSYPSDEFGNELISINFLDIFNINPNINI